ncbi:MBL fold metallo-hydrolase [Sphingomonas endolithica]|uniref:MBL fold metallo-hydrolase n=1 Tax=Sphingomonas endolithica TaxID=2972485 RepID=UPI0021AF156C|nr:MBL fold metallo-hydrolase [Sphingomonas sp. ZFBP2030]
MTTITRSPVLHTLALAAGIALAAGGAHGSPYSAINAAAAVDPVKVQKLRGGIAMLSGSGGNIGALAGADGLFLVDAGIAISKAKIEAALRTVGNGPVRYVVNTHWHWDHADGNGWLRRAGATIIADRQAQLRLTETLRIVEWEHTFTPISPADLPQEVLSADRIMHFGDQTIAIGQYRPGHTDGDMSVYFKQADVLATGDTFWNGMYPFIDYVGGGDIDGAIRAADANLLLAGTGTQIIPGHGPVGDRAQLIAFRDMLVTVRSKVAALKKQGMSEEQVVASRPTAALDATWGRALINGALFTRLVYRGV